MTMNTYRENDHPRDGDGRFATKGQVATSGAVAALRNARREMPPEAIEEEPLLVPWGEWDTLARALRITDAEMREAHRERINVHHYVLFRRRANHAEIMEAHRADVNLYLYDGMRAESISHAEIMEAHRGRINLAVYEFTRNLAPHSEIMEANRSGRDMMLYGLARSCGANHDEAIKRAGAL